MSSNRKQPENLQPQIEKSASGARLRSFRSDVAHAGEGTEERAFPLVEPIHQSSAYAFDDSDHADQTFAEGGALYARDGLPNVRSLERVVARLEGAEDAIAVSSGMAAIATTCLALLNSGDHVLVGHDGYCDTAALLDDLSTRFGIRVSRVDLNDTLAVEAAITPETRLVLAETISNPGMRLTDISSLVAITRPHGIQTVVDNTFATPALCRPIEFGADAVLHSAGKFLAGHSDVTAGVVAGSAPLIARLKRSAYLYGPLLAPMEAWLTLRGMRTLLPRVMWASQSAMRVALWLQTHPMVAEVNHVSLPGHDQALLVERMLPEGAGSVLTFRLHHGEAAAMSLLRNLRSIPYAPTVGGPATIASFPPRTPRFDAHGQPVLNSYRCSTIRLSVGLEDPDDILADLDGALRATVDRDESESRKNRDQ